MIQSTSLPCSGAVARSLLRLATITEAQIDPAIADLAVTDLITDWTAIEAEGPIGPVGRRATQFLLDQKWRAVIPMLHSEITPTLLLKATRLFDGPVTIATIHATRWQVDLGRLGIAAKVTNPLALLRNTQASYQGLLLIDWCHLDGIARSSEVYRGLAAEWPHSVICGEVSASIDFNPNRASRQPRNPWGGDVHIMASCLYPALPTTMMVSNRRLAQSQELGKRGFLSHKPDDLAFLCGIFVP